MILYHLLFLLMPFWQYSRLPLFAETFTLIKVVGGLVVVAALARFVIVRRPVHYFRSLEGRCFFLLIAISTLSGFQARRMDWMLDRLFSLASFAAFLFATLVLLDTVRRVERSCYTLVLAMLVASAYVYNECLRWNSHRPGGVFGDANYYSLAAVTVLPLTYTLFRTASGPRAIFLCLTGVSLIASVLLGQSRGGAVTLAFCLLYLFIRTRQRALLLTCLALVLIPLLVYLPQTGLTRFSDGDPGARKSTERRIALLQAGWNMIAEHPFAGVGVGQFKDLSKEYNESAPSQIAHNTYVEVAAELGVPACVAFLAILWRTWTRARALARMFHKKGVVVGEQIATGLEAGIASFAVGAVFLSAEHMKYLWMIVFLGLALQRIADLEGQGQGPHRKAALAGANP